ncbi:unnamed protein product [Musa acuminata subsp. malaccensis]|uniref:(wild Malaysian banana) hypothetical protein n=1 Tax=Musa acuminata subsp. malaccensis TaxID=214687 RepID=A0A804K3C1_MUSAM|nr:PREDICTED: uncharacterized protein LOC103993734 isoform X1 [Musa acuminata subsp. malaccensis]CAG1830690.1 unnamed protein product [Musa acuminata subsp. malaccensis]
MSSSSAGRGSRGRGRKSYGLSKAIAGFFSSSNSREPPPLSCSDHFTPMLRMITLKLRRLCSLHRWPLKRRRAKTTVPIYRFGRPTQESEAVCGNRHQPAVRSGDLIGVPESTRPIRLATFNAAMFSMAPAVPKSGRCLGAEQELDMRCKAANDRPKSILKQPSLAKAKLRVSINLPDNEISVERSKQSSSRRQVGEETTAAWKGKAPVSHSFSMSAVHGLGKEPEKLRADRSILEVLREVGADVIGLQNVKAEEEKGMKPLSDLAEGLGMKYVFAESWAPEYGNAILSKWPIKQWKAEKILDDADFRNVLKATIEVPGAGEVEFHCTHLDHLDENWRMKQINSILRSSDRPHILVGGLNSLDETDYSAERWADIVKYYEEIGKPTPKVEVMKFLRGKQYLDAKNFAGECEAVVVVAKGQDVQGTCKYGTRVDYILSSPYSPYKFVPGSYGVLSSKGTSDHHIVKVDMVIAKTDGSSSSRHHPWKQRVVKMDASSSKGIWDTDL